MLDSITATISQTKNIFHSLSSPVQMVSKVSEEDYGLSSRRPK